MDPQACLERWRAARAAKNARESSEALCDLADWLNGGGFWPTGLTAREAARMEHKTGRKCPSESRA